MLHFAIDALGVYLLDQGISYPAVFLHRTVCLLLARSRERDDEREAARTESEATSAAGETAKKVNGMGQHETA